MLQSVDIAVAFAAAHRLRRDGAWSPTIVRDDLNLPWSSLHLALERLDSSNVVRGGRVIRPALAALLRAIPYLCPAVANPARRVVGIATGASAPVFDGRLVMQAPLVWESTGGTMKGAPIIPLHSRIPAAVVSDPQRYALFACLDAIRGGRARELGVARPHVLEMVGLPTRT